MWRQPGNDINKLYFKNKQKKSTTEKNPKSEGRKMGTTIK